MGPKISTFRIFCCWFVFAKSKIFLWSPLYFHRGFFISAIACRDDSELQVLACILYPRYSLRRRYWIPALNCIYIYRGNLKALPQILKLKLSMIAASVTWSLSWKKCMSCTADFTIYWMIESQNYFGKFPTIFLNLRCDLQRESSKNSENFTSTIK